MRFPSMVMDSVPGPESNDSDLLLGLAGPMSGSIVHVAAAKFPDASLITVDRATTG